MNRDPQIISLLILERGAVWPVWSRQLRAASLHLVVESQLELESVAEFQVRVSERLDKMKEKGERALTAGYVCCLDSRGREESRLSLMRALLRVLGREENAELIIAGGPWAADGEGGRERMRLVKLWAQLSEEAPRQLVSVRFEDPPATSGSYTLPEVNEEEWRARPGSGLLKGLPS